MSKNLSAKYHRQNKGRLQKKGCERHQNISKKEKEKKQQYNRKLYKNLSEDDNNKLVEYRKRYKMRKIYFFKKVMT